MMTNRCYPSSENIIPHIFYTYNSFNLPVSDLRTDSDISAPKTLSELRLEIP